jgi:uncharacterized repeat protein (TIGR01451 family)
MSEESKPSFRKKRVTSPRGAKKGMSEQTQKIQTELTSIYENTDGSLPDMSTFEQRRKGSFLRSILMLVCSLALLGGAVYAGLFYLDSGDQFSKQDVFLSIKSEETVTNGEHITYRISYRNAQKLPIAQARLQVRYPEGFVFESASVEPQNEAKNEWSLGTLERNANGYIDIGGKLYGNSGENQSVRVFFTYLPANFSSEFQTVETFITKIDDGALALSVEGADEIVSGVEAPFVIRLKPKESTQTFTGVVLDITGDNLGIVSSTPAVEKNNTTRIVLPEFTGELAVPVSVRFSGSGAAAMQVTLSQGGKTNQEEVVLSQAQKQVTLTNTDVSLSFALNGASGNMSVRPGETLNNTIRVKNTSAQKVDNVEVKLSFDTPSFQNTSLLKWSAITDPKDGTITGEQRSVDVRRGNIVWTKAQIPALASLDPGEEVSIDLSLPLKTSADTDLSAFPNGGITVMPSVTFAQAAASKTIATEPMELTVLSDTSLRVRHVTEGNAHTVTWILENSLHELNTIVLEADVFGDVAWVTENVEKSAGTVAYDDKTKKIRWEIPTMPPSVDVNSLSFTLRLNSSNPTQTNLTSKVKLSAKDTVVNQDLLLAGDEVKLK